MTEASIGSDAEGSDAHQPQLVNAVRDAALHILLEAHEDAGLRGLCGEGRWEYAVGVLRAMDARTLAARAGVSAAERPPE